MNCRKPVELMILAVCAVVAGAGIVLAQQPVPPTPRDVTPPTPQRGPTPPPPFSTQLQISSPVFAANGSIPSKYTCDGPGMSALLKEEMSALREDPNVPARTGPTESKRMDQGNNI